jgi:CRISPR/Cas system-associated exonuclease Cas4 (RecB family)
MGHAWSGQDVRKEYIDWEDERDRNAEKFQVLLQQGSFRLYIVNSMKDGKQSRPCLLFDHASGEPKKTFGSVCGELIKGTWSSDPAAVNRRTAAGTDGMFKAFSKTSLNNYVTCPLKFMFSELVRAMPENEDLLFGNVMHEFAEFCICYPELVEKNGIDTYAEMISELYAGMACPEKREIDRSRIRTMLRNIRSFVASVPRVPLDITIEKRRRQNMFFKHHSLTTASSNAESSFGSKSSMLYGEFDLVFGGRIFDYKTGRPKTPEKIRESTDETRRDGFFDSQALVYLALLDDNDPGGCTDFNIVYLLNSASDAGGNIRSVRLVSTTTAEFIRTELRDIVAGRYEEMGSIWTAFSELLIRIGPRNTEGWKESEDLETLLKSKKMKVKPSTIINSVIKTMSGRAILSDDGLIVTKDMLDEFRSFVKEKHAEMIVLKRTSFPAAVTRNCKYCSFRSMCMAMPGEDESDE